MTIYSTRCAHERTVLTPTMLVNPRQIVFISPRVMGQTPCAQELQTRRPILRPVAKRRTVLGSTAITTIKSLTLHC